jgi:hypothetical protein
MNILRILKKVNNTTNNNCKIIPESHINNYSNININKTETQTTSVESVIESNEKIVMDDYTFTPEQNDFILSLFPTIKHFQDFNYECKQIYDLQYIHSSGFDMFDYFSEHGMEYTLSSNGMTSRTALVIDILNDYSPKLRNLAEQNRFREFKNTWCYLKHYMQR